MTASKADFRRKLDRALESDRLRVALQRALPALGVRRADRMREIDWDALRADLTERKRRAIDDMPALIERFTREAEAVGAKVYRAADAEEARRVVAAICRTKKARLVVKSKSMVTVAVARDKLRDSFLKADIGITGGNILIADTGTLVLVTNEGNADLATSLPPVHIAIVGVEKVVPTLDDAVAVLKLLARSATGQKITTYTQFITGPSRSADIELKTQIGVHGPKELHFVLVDNGRTVMRDDPAFREALRCIKCGACSNVCPTYQVVGGHVFGHVYTGPIGLVVSPFHHGLDSVAYEQQMCVGCNACDTVCPVTIPIASLITDVRAMAVQRTGLSWAKRLALGQWTAPERIDRMTGWLSALQGPLRRGTLVRLPFGDLGKEKSLPAVAAQPLHYRAREITQTNPESPTTRIGLFPSCIVDHFLPGAGYAAARVLQAFGAEVHVVEGRRCCGLPHMNSGDREAARTMAKDAIAALERVQADHLVLPSSSCAITMAQDYERLLAEEPEWAERARKLAERIKPFTTLVHELARENDLTGRRLDLRATYHDSCQSANVLGINYQPRDLLRNIAGVDVIEMADSAVCCGFGGTFSFEYPDVANYVLEKKLTNINATGAEVVITDNPGCLTHLRGGLDARGQRIKVRHLAEVLWEALEPS